MKIQNLSFYFCCCMCFSHTEIPFYSLKPTIQNLHYTLYERALKNVNNNNNGYKKNYLSAEIWIYFKDGNIEKCPVLKGQDQYFVSEENKQTIAIPELEVMFDMPKLKLYVEKNGKKENNLCDTEYQLIGILNSRYNNIFQQINDKGEIPSAIELHCFSTRDMCPCCYQHMQNFLDQANQHKEGNFFTELIETYRGADSTQVPITFYVSSACGFTNEKNPNDFIYSLYSYCDYRLDKYIAKEAKTKEINCIFFRKKPEDIINPEQINNKTVKPYWIEKFDKLNIAKKARNELNKKGARTKNNPFGRNKFEQDKLNSLTKEIKDFKNN